MWTSRIDRYVAIEHPGGEGVAVEYFELALERFLVCLAQPSPHFDLLPYSVFLLIIPTQQSIQETV